MIATRRLAVVVLLGVVLAFTVIGGTLDSATFYLGNSGAAAGDVWACVYAHSDTFGVVDGKPSGTPLGVSSPVDAATIDTAPELVTFHFDNALSHVY